MAFCSNCGKGLQEGAKFCNACGTSVTGAEGVSIPGATAPANTVVVIGPKKGGRLAFKGFLAAVILATIFIVATKDEQGMQSAGMVIGFGIGAVYIITSLLKWKKNNEVVHGASIGWTVAVLLLIVCFANLVNVGDSGNETSVSSSLSNTSTPIIDPKEVLLRDVKLDYKWYKEGFGEVMIADFTIKNPTQYRFKDFEIKCTHAAPSGTIIDSNTRIIYETVEPKSTKVVSQINMGFINSQVARSSCEITDLTPIQ